MATPGILYGISNNKEIVDEVEAPTTDTCGRRQWSNDRHQWQWRKEEEVL